MENQAELDQIRELEAKIRQLSREQADDPTDPELQAQLNTHLLSLVEHRAQEVERINRLLQSNIQELKTRKERLATTVHDLKIPITVSMLNLELAEQESGASPQAMYLNAVRRELAFMLDTIANLLDLERSESMADDLRLEPCQLRDIATEVLRRMSVLIKDRPNLALHNAVPADLPPVTCDRHRITRVFNNLLSNAIKYTESGTVTLRGAVGNQPGSVQLFIEDTGSGMDATRLSSLFKLFQGDAARYDSSGVGLVYVKKTVESHGGKVSIQSERGKGTTVTLDLPVAGK